MAMAVVGLVVLVALAGVGAHLAHEVGRIPGAFTGLGSRPEEPPGAAAAAMDVLLVGVYGQTDGTTWVPGHRRPASLMLVHLNGDRRAGSVVALPLGAEVQVSGHGSPKLGSVFRLGGAALLVRTVEQLTRTRIDHLAVFDWVAMGRLTASLGGVELGVDEGEVDEGTPSSNRRKAYVDGDSVLSFVSDQRVGEVARMHRQLIVIDEVMRGSLDQSMHTRPWQAYRFIDEVAAHLAVESGWSSIDMASLALSLWSLRSADILYATAPVTCSASPAGVCQAVLDQTAGPSFWRAAREDCLARWLTRHDARGAANVTRLQP